MTTAFAFAFTVAALAPIVILMHWWRTDARQRYCRVRRPPLRVPVALEVHHHGRLALALSDWSAWRDPATVAVGSDDVCISAGRA